ncbi:MAG: potassium transporter TrkG [Candidatus Woesearchaeota archaeon]
MKALLSNIGFVMQAAGLLIFLPIIISFIYKEPAATIALFLVSTLFLGLGFMLNALCERKKLNYKQSCSLIVLAFVMLSVVGAVPYWYVLDEPLLQRLTDGVFESASGFTTTGFSVLENLQSVPKSILFYRAITQFIGGIGIVLLLLAFFYPEQDLRHLSKSLGFGKNKKIKKTFYLILAVYLSFSVALIISSVFFGFYDIVTLSSLVLSAISTGGFTPVADIGPIAHDIPMNAVLIFAMLVGASNFLVLAGLFMFKWKEFLKSEITFFVMMASVAVAFAVAFFDMGFFDSVFHVVSAMSTTGFSYLDIAILSTNIKLFFVALMFVGGASLSTAGGIKIYRFVLFFKLIQKTVHDSITAEPTRLRVFGRECSNQDIMHATVIVVSVILAVFFSAILLSGAGYSLVDSIFDATSAISTVGLGAGVVSHALAVKFKWLFIGLMLLGRVEIFSFFVMFSRAKEPKQ